MRPDMITPLIGKGTRRRAAAAQNCTAEMPAMPLSSPWIYLASLLAVLMVLSNILWQRAHGWPFLEIGKAGASGKNIEMSLQCG